VDFRILGPLEVFEGGRGVVLGGGKQRALLAVLVLHRNEIVSSDRLIDMLWSGRPPATAAKIVQLYVSQLRKVLGSEILVTQAPGYVLRLEAGQLDADRFKALLAEARRALADTAPEQAAALLREALDLWRGRPLADFAYDDFAQAEIARLEELRLTALEERVEADLALGRHGDLAVELEALVSQHPLRERLCGQLMLARYRCGRQAEALETYREARRLLDQELGLEPSQSLQDLERAILRQEPALAPPSRVEPFVEGGIASIVPPSLRRRSAAFLVAGGVLVGAGIAAAVLELTGGGSPREPVQNAVVEIDASTAHIGSYTPVGKTPSDIAVGEGGVWVLNADDGTVSLIDPRTHRLVKTFATSGTPTELAVGAGAVWVGIGKRTPPLSIGSIYTARLSRIDPSSALVTRTLELPGPLAFQGYGPLHLLPFNQLAIGAGAVWAVNPDLTVSRIDPTTGRLAAVIDVSATKGIAAGREGVWVVGRGTTLTRIDPRTNRAGQTITLEATGLEELALGDGSVWTTDPSDGLVWRVEPGPHPLTRSIAVGPGVVSIAFADGAVWAASFLDGTIVRIDPRTNAVTARVRVVATPDGIAVAGGSVWVSVAGVTTRGTLPTGACGPIATAGDGKPNVLIASSLPLQGPDWPVTRTMAEAIGFVLRKHAFRAGRYRVGYQSCDDSTARSGSSDFFKCAANAKAFAETADVVAVIGPFASFCADAEIPLTNRLASPLALVSPSNTRPGLTRTGPGVLRGEPGSHYPTGVRSYFRLAPPDDVLGAGDAVLAKQLGLRSVYVLTTGETPYGIELASGFGTAARRFGLRLAGSGKWNPNAKSYAQLAERIALSGADGVLLGDFPLNAGMLIKALRARLGRKVTLISGDAFVPVSDTLKAAGRAAFGMYVTIPGVALEKLGPAGRRFAREFGATQQGGAIASGTYVPEAAEAAEVLLRAIAHSDGTRASVLAALQHVEMADGILGGFRFDPNGDMTPALVTAFRVTGRTAPGSRLVSDFRGAEVDRIIRVPAALFARPGG
jgi:DNA-binding SARP family transcriptional activator/ABC-type branched-subunit amino acid transport system substrate-binding protein/streptogramin lyase